MAIADIQINPAELPLDAATRKGRFDVTITNQLGRDGRLLIAVLPVAGARAEWLALDARHKELGLKKDETAVFAIEVAVPMDAAPGSYGMKVECADELDPKNVLVQSEQRNFVVPAAAKPLPARWWRWALIGLAGALLIGGGVWLAIELTKKGCTKDQDCAAGRCEGGTCIGVAPPPDGGCVAEVDRPCGQCRGRVLCDGTCSRPTPPRLGLSCGQCGGKIDCEGACAPADPPGLGTTCGQCGGKIGCDGQCSVATPPDFGRVSERVFTVAFRKGEHVFGGPCEPGHELVSASVAPVSGIGACHGGPMSGGGDCRVKLAVLVPPLLTQRVECRIAIKTRRVCD